MKFTGENILEFTDHFKDDTSCLEYLSEYKWVDGYNCKKCGHTKFTVRKKNLARDCNRCHHIESPTANTLFHRIRFSIRKAFMIIFEMSASTKGLSCSQVSKRYSISRTTAWTFMHKVRVSMGSSRQHPMVGDVQVDEFVYGGKESLKQGRSNDTKKKKIIGAVELNKEGKVKTGQTHTFILSTFSKYSSFHPALSLFPAIPCFSDFSFLNKFSAILRSTE